MVSFKQGKKNALPGMHGENITIDTTSSSITHPSACLQAQLHKTKLCAYNLKGICQYGKECQFAHSKKELQTTPDLSKTRLCKSFQQQGYCDDPKNCKYAHGDEELRSTINFYRKSLCIWYEKGMCRHGDQCRFAHGLEQLRQIPIGQQREHAAKKKAKEDAKVVPGEAHCPPAVSDMHPCTGNPGAGPPSRSEPMKIYPGSFLRSERSAPAAKQQMPHSAVAPTTVADLRQSLEEICSHLKNLSLQYDRTYGESLGPLCAAGPGAGLPVLKGAV